MLMPENLSSHKHHITKLGDESREQYQHKVAILIPSSAHRLANFDLAENVEAEKAVPVRLFGLAPFCAKNHTLTTRITNLRGVRKAHQLAILAAEN